MTAAHVRAYLPPLGVTMTRLRALYERLKEQNERFALWLSGLMSWPFWLPAILLLSATAVALRWVDATVYILTVQTSIDAAATKMLQNHLRAQDERRDAILQENVEMLTALVLEVRGMADQIIDLAEALQRDARRAAKRDKMMLTALESRGDLYDFLRKGVIRGDATGEAARRAGRARQADGRANRTRS